MASHEQLVEWGRKGGKARAAAAGNAGMKAIGAQGGRATHARHGSRHMAAAGRLGWQALIGKVGIAGAVERLHTWKLAHPSELETVAARALAGLGLAEGEHYERDARVSADPPIFGDFVFRVRRLIVEVDGRRWHTNDPLHGEDRLARDVRRDRLLTAAGWRVVRLDERTVRDGAALRAALLSALDIAYATGEEG